MKRKLLNIILLALCGAVWLYKCHMAPVEWGYLAACLVSYLCLTLVPQRLASLIAVTAVTVGMSVFFPHYLYCYAPVLLACAALFAAFSDKKNRPIGKDGVFLAALGLSGVASAISMYESLAVQKDVSFMLIQFERYHIYAILFTALVVFLTADSLRLFFRNRKADTQNTLYIKLFAVYAIMLVSFAAAALLYFKDVSTGKMSLLPVFTGAFTAITEGMRAYTEKRAQPAPDGPAALNNTPKKRRKNA